MAERGGFEPPVGYKPTHAFQACALNHSAISPFGLFHSEHGSKAMQDFSNCTEWTVGAKTKEDSPDGKLLKRKWFAKPSLNLAT
jgi:hypothetical protein